MKISPFVIVLALMSVTELAHAAESGVSISIAVPALDPGKERSVVAFDRNSHFPVILTNTSKKPQRIITEWNSWGDHALSFELTDKSGKKSLAQKVSVDYAKNTSHWWILQPQESVVLDVYFADTEKWEGFPHPVRYGDSEIVTLRAIFEFRPDVRKPLADGLWSGRVFSAPEQIVFYNQMPEKK